jgi:DNA-binding FadR family transcriptional regulator
VFREIQTQIRNYIIENDLKPGDRLPSSSELADRLGVSSASLREALRALAALGVLETKHGVGTFIRAYDLSPILENLSFSLTFEKNNLAELVQVREAMEAGLLEEVIVCIEDDRLLELDAALAQMSDPDNAREADYVFHQTLYRCLDSKLVAEFLDIFWLVYHDLTERHMIPAPRKYNHYQDHAPILNAVRAKDLDGASKALRAHFRHIKERINNGVVASSLD